MAKIAKKVRRLNITLIWKGPYSAPDKLPEDKAGIYMVLAGRKAESGKWKPDYKLLDIGQTEDVDDRFEPHGREECWENKKPKGSTILYKFAEMDKNKYNNITRRIVECCLRFCNPTTDKTLPCGKECNESYGRDDTVIITNEGSYSPLKEKYSCGPNTKSRKKKASEQFIDMFYNK